MQEESTSSTDNMDNRKVASTSLSPPSSITEKVTKDGARPRNGSGHRRGGLEGSPPTLCNNTYEGRRQFKGRAKKGRRYSQQRQDDFGEHPVTGDDEFEVGSVFNTGSKKQNINQLLNFEFEPINTGSSKTPVRSNGSSSQCWRRKFNKEQYLQANCQFVVKSSGDYSEQLKNPDSIVNWNLIEQVILETTAAVPSCPICLYEPKAAKITKCGHIFCWPCILHYLALSDQAKRKCPICHVSVYHYDLRSVAMIARDFKNVGDHIEFFLMRRERTSLFAVHVDRYVDDINGKHPELGDHLTSHSRIILATPDQVADNIIAKERSQLEHQYRQDKHEPEACFIEEALQYLAKRETDNLEVIYRPRHSSSSSEGASSTSRDLEQASEDNCVTVKDLDLSVVERSSKGNKKKDTFYFYQSSDGQPIYLHALNVQMLVHDYGSMENCPSIIRGRILEKDHATMTEDLRNKLRYLKHLPLTSSFEVCEIDMGRMVTKVTMDHFRGQVDKRKRMRSKRARDERRREKWIAEEEGKKMGMYPAPKFKIESTFHFPEVGGLEAPTMRSPESLISAGSMVNSPSEGGHQGQLSFAKMLRDGVARPPVMHRSETFPRADVEHVDYECAPAQVSFGDALAQAFAQATTLNQGTTAANQDRKGKKKGKKMKGTKILLTGSTRPTMD